MDGRYFLRTPQRAGNYNRARTRGIGSIVSVNYGEHDLDDLFDPTYIELPMLTKPLSGQYFSSDKTSNISGTVAGGDCEFSLTTDAGDIEVTLSAVNVVMKKR